MRDETWKLKLDVFEAHEDPRSGFVEIYANDDGVMPLIQVSLKFDAKEMVPVGGLMMTLAEAKRLSDRLDRAIFWCRDREPVGVKA